MVNTIMRDFGYIPVEFRDDWGVWTRELTVTPSASVVDNFI